jgi:hypothetical protein
MERRDEEALAVGVNFILKDRAKKAVNSVCSDGTFRVTERLA